MTHILNLMDEKSADKLTQLRKELRAQEAAARLLALATTPPSK